MVMSVLDPLDLSRFFEQHPTLETERLILRELTHDDAADLFVYYGDPVFTEYVSFDPFKDITVARDEVDRVRKGFEKRKHFVFGIERKSDRKIIGDCDLHHISPNDHRVEIGYGLARAYWGFGYMTEAVSEVIRFAFEGMGFHRIEAECELENLRACRVAERCGMALEATRHENEINKGRFVSNHVYAIVRNEK